MSFLIYPGPQPYGLDLGAELRAVTAWAEATDTASELIEQFEDDLRWARAAPPAMSAAEAAEHDETFALFESVLAEQSARLRAEYALSDAAFTVLGELADEYDIDLEQVTDETGPGVDDDD